MLPSRAGGGKAMSGSDYGDLKRAHAARKSALEAEKKKSLKNQAKQDEKLKRENAHGYPTLNAAHLRIARERAADAALRDNAASATAPRYDNVRNAKPMQIDRQFAVTAKVEQQAPVRMTGQLSPSPGGTSIIGQLPKLRASPAAPARKENSDQAVARGNVARRGETTDAVVKKQTAKTNSTGTHANGPDGSRPTGRGGRGR